MAKNAGIAPLVEKLITPEVEKNGCTVYDVEYVKEGAEMYLRITVDSENGVDLDLCEKVHRAIEPIIDEADPIEDSYYLEVSSTGLERTLRKPKHFMGAVSEKAEIKLFTADESGKKSYVGTIVSATEDSFVLNDGVDHVIPYSAVSKANIVYDFEDLGKDN